ncbi:MAG: 4a-hydroxytetrahydrobiopterin dehydratase [Gammaproteobacteria bacterium]|nr:4a-hydroxytetrahydrobiopterin dehydratase [Gammaproteobacteria bacterium]
MLDSKHCVPCRGGIPPLEEEQAQSLLKQVPKWALIDNATKIRRRFAFDNFAESLAFVNKVGQIAEDEGHHPDITFGWGYAEVIIYSHKIGGLHENDFILAHAIDKL